MKNGNFECVEIYLGWTSLLTADIDQSAAATRHSSNDPKIAKLYSVFSYKLDILPQQPRAHPRQLMADR